MARQVLTGDTRAYHAPVIMPDAKLEFWADVYRVNPQFAARGITLEQFLSRPEFYLYGPREYVLSSKERVILREALTRSVLIVSNGQQREKLRHHRHPRGAFRAFIKSES